MVLPLIVAIGGRVAVSVILRAIAANRTRAIAKYGSGAVNKALKMSKNYKGKDKSVLQAIGKVTKKVKTAIKPKVKTKSKVTFKPKSKKQIAIQKKIKAKVSKKPTKKPPSKVTTATKTTKVKPKVSKKPIKKPPSKVTTATKPTKVKTKPSKKPTKKPTKKPVTTAVKPKPKFKPGFLTGVTVGGGAPLLYNLLTKKKKSPPGIGGDKIVPKPKPKTPYPKDDDFDKDSSPYIKGSAAPKKTADRSLYQTAKPSATFEARVRALVAQKDKLKNVEAGDGRSEYQVRMHKLKKENKKAWKKLFTIGGKLK